MTTTFALAGLLPTSPEASAAAENGRGDPDGLLPPGDWEPWQEERMLDLIAATKEQLPASIDAGTLSDMGFIDISIATPGGIEHWYNIPRFFDEHLVNPEYPESLVTRRTATGHRELVAVMYHMDFGDTMDDIPEELRWLPGWHPHVEACVDTVGQVVALTIPGTNSCPPGSQPARGPPMMHVWIVDNECGHRFAGVGLGGIHCHGHGHSGDADPVGSGSGYPSGGHGEAELDGSITVGSVPTGFGPGGPVAFPSGGNGVCNPDGRSTTLAAVFGDDHDGHVPVTEIEAEGQPADVVVTNDGAICGEVTLEASGGGIHAGDGGTGTFRLSGVTAEVEIAGTGAFEPHIPAGCSLSLDVGELTGSIDGGGPPNAASLAASNVSVAEAPDSCGGYSQLLDVGFSLPSTDAEIELDLSIGWGGSGPGGPPPEPSDEIEVTSITTRDGGGALGNQPIINGHGAIAFTPDGTSDAILLEDGQVTRINPEGTRAELGAITDEGQVVGTTGPSVWEGSPFSWEHGEWEILPIGEAFAGRALDANDHGMVAGSLMSDVFDNGEPVVWDDGEIVKPPDELTLIPMVPVSTPAINNRNQYAFNILTDDPGGATIWDVDGGEVVDLGTLGGGFSMVTAINDRGMATGVSTNADDELRAFLWHDGEMTDLGTLGGMLSVGLSLNEWGHVIGVSEDADGQIHGFLWHDGEMTRIEGLGGAGDSATGLELGMTSYPLAVNNWGQVVGTSPAPEGGSQAFLWQNGRTVNLGELADPDLESRAVDINDRGQIPGYTKPSAETGDGHLWTVSPLWGYPDGL